jgi:hypothetical protein
MFQNVSASEYRLPKDTGRCAVNDGDTKRGCCCDVDIGGVDVFSQRFRIPEALSLGKAAIDLYLFLCV